MEAISRTCTEISQNSNNSSLPLKKFRTEAAYVLLGDPGSGKSTEFEIESDDLGDDAILTSARDFLTFDVASHPEWRGLTIFIDGLDEVRSGYTDSRTPFDIIRNKLDNLGRPAFRISCREADWLGENDRKHLITVSPNSQIKMLRLDPLNESDINNILAYNSTIDNIESFKAETQRRNLEALLLNPQSLLLLAKAVAQEGIWPQSRLDTFEKACQQLVIEHNQEHKISEQQSPHKILDIAGYLCTIQLISGATGYSLDHDRIDDNYLALDTWENESPETIKQTLSTKLFRASTRGNGYFMPLHRHIAEFLAARHLARLINNGLPVSRVISLIIGEDGGVVSEFRGLSAWLAAHPGQARVDLIERDPIGIGLYGDIQGFSAEEKQQLLTSLKREVIGFVDIVWQTASAFVSLASTELELAISSELSDPCRDRNHQIFIDLLLRILSQGRPLPDLASTILSIVRDSNWYPRVTLSALDAYIHTTGCGQARDDSLLQLLDDIQVGLVPDSDGELLGTILDVLYPEKISPSNIWNYMTEKGHRSFPGRHKMFWRFNLLAQSSDADIIDLLDSLYEQTPVVRAALKSRELQDLPVDILARGLDTHDIEQDIARLYNWLGAGITNGLVDFYPNDESVLKIRTWLEEHPEIQKKIFLEGLVRCAKDDDSAPSVYAVRYRQYGSVLPSDFGLWCLNKAAELSDMNPQVSKHLFQEAILSYQNQTYAQGLSESLILERAWGNKVLKNLLVVEFNPQIDKELGNIQREYELKMKKYEEERDDEREQWMDHLRSSVEPLQGNRASPALLHDIARAYFGLLSGQYWRLDLDNEQTLREFLEGDEELLQIALEGIYYTIWRKDIPDIKDILRIKSESKIPYLAYPVLASIDQIRQVSPAKFKELTNDQIHKAVALYYNYNIGWVGDSEWYLELVLSSPEVVADVLIKCVRFDIHNKEKSIPVLQNLAYMQNHAQIARYASIPLLRAFPTRCNLDQINSLDYLLWSALQHVDEASFKELIKKKLSAKTMIDVQKVHWLAAGTVVSPENYCSSLATFVEGDDKRTRQLAKFFCPQQKIPILTDRLQPITSQLLIRLVGASFGPFYRNGLVTIEIEAADLISHLIQRLASSPGEDATRALEDLSSDAALHHWHDPLCRARDNQKVIYRDAVYRSPDVKKILQTLSNKAPSNVADLAALMVARLSTISDRIRTSNTDDWRQYWNEDSYGRPITPKNEDSCRDALLSDMREQLPQGVDAQPEGQYANDKRADIRVSYQNFNLPMEVKKNNHRDLWSALRNQLVERYASDPAAGGYGIYLVFWFGEEYTHPPPHGKRPANPEEMKDRLQSMLADEEESRKITVCVVDVQKP